MSKSTWLRCAALVLATMVIADVGAASALEWTAEDLYTRIVDVGPGLCTITVAPGGHVMIYDAEHWQGGHCLAAARGLVPAHKRIDLFVVSHSDGDHLGDAAEILDEFEVKMIIHTGEARPGAINWDQMMLAISAERATELDLGQEVIFSGTQWPLEHRRS